MYKFRMQNNPAYGIPSEIIKHTSLPTTREENERRAQQRSKRRPAVPKLSIVALFVAILALAAALVCFIFIFTDNLASQAGEPEYVHEWNHTGVCW